MTSEEKKLLQAKHRLEEAQARDRVKERKARTRRLKNRLFCPCREGIRYFCILSGARITMIALRMRK